jgi:YegS/Rv2252/BmrU family lipid kinase
MGEFSTYIIANPASGAFSTKFLDSVVRDLESFVPKVHMTQSTGDATLFARNCPDGSLIVCIGGDGTLNEVVNGMAGSDKTLVIAGGGTGSDLGRTLGFVPPGSIGSSLNNPRLSMIDLGMVRYSNGTRYFANVMEIGFGASVMMRVNSSRGGRINPFTLSVLKELPHLKSYHLHIDSDPEHRDLEAIEVVIANCRYFGGGMLASPLSDPADGSLDLHAVPAMSRLSLIRRFGKLRSGEYVKLDEVVNISSSEFRISGDAAPFEIDGECIGSTPVEISVAKGALRVLTPGSHEQGKAIT